MFLPFWIYDKANSHATLKEMTVRRLQYSQCLEELFRTTRLSFTETERSKPGIKVIFFFDNHRSDYGVLDNECRVCTSRCVGTFASQDKVKIYSCLNQES